MMKITTPRPGPSPISPAPFSPCNNTPLLMYQGDPMTDIRTERGCSSRRGERSERAIDANFNC